MQKVTALFVPPVPKPGSRGDQSTGPMASCATSSHLPRWFGRLEGGEDSLGAQINNCTRCVSLP